MEQEGVPLSKLNINHLWDEWMLKLYSSGADSDVLDAMRVVFNR